MNIVLFVYLRICVKKNILGFILKIYIEELFIKLIWEFLFDKYFLKFKL